MTIELKYRLTYDGGEAERNRLPAHQGATSLEGISWSVSLIANYAITGRIRSRGDLSPKLKVFLLPGRQGSFITDIVVFVTEPNNIFLTSVVGSYVASTVGQMVNSLVVSTVREVCGLAISLSQREEGWLKRLPSGDREALVDKIEPSMKRAHGVIDEGVETIMIQKGYTPLVQLDHLTKAYVNADLAGDETTKKVSIGALNANTGNGRLYIKDLGKTVPFYVPKDLEQTTYAALSYSLDQYVNNRPSTILVESKEVLALDGRIKRLLIQRAMKLP